MALWDTKRPVVTSCFIYDRIIHLPDEEALQVILLNPKRSVAHARQKPE